MTDVDVDVVALHEALEKMKAEHGTSWREIARQIGVSASTMSRLAQGFSPDVKAFARMVRWLNVPAETFIREGGHPVDPPGVEGPEPELLVELAPLLRARRDLDPHDVRHLEELIGSALRRFKAEKSSTER